MARWPDGLATMLAKFDYTYDAVGNILTWRQQADSTAVMWKYGYDPADQLISAVKHATDTNQTVLQRFAYAYDPAGNRTIEQIDDAVTLSAYDNLNRLTSQAPGGPMVIAGTLNEPGTVTISGKPAIVDANNTFRGTVTTTTGTNAFTIVAKDASGNITTQNYEVDLTGSTKSFTYDANGNLTSDGEVTFEWNAINQLVAKAVGTYRYELEFDANYQAVQVVTKNSGVITGTVKSLWCDGELCEDRGIDGSTLLKRTFRQGEFGTQAEWTATDHLGSVREVIDQSGLKNRWSYEPWGRATSDYGSTGVPTFASIRGDQIGSYSALFRQYSPDLGRWLSEDPIGFISPDGPNVNTYVMNNPVGFLDPLGLQRIPSVLPFPPPTPPNCMKVGSMYICRPDVTPKMCAAQPRRCTPYVDRVLYWSCLMVRIPAPSFNYPGLGGVGGGVVTTAFNCAQMATACKEGGFPPAANSPPDAQIGFHAIPQRTRIGRR